MKWIKGISPTVRILIMAIVLILLPAAVLSYIGLVSVNERARNLETGYRGTVLLVRDRIEQEILRLEQNLRSSLEKIAPECSERGSSRKLLKRVESDNPWLKHPFMARSDGEIITPSLFLEASYTSEPQFDSQTIDGLFRRAEETEFAVKDIEKARRMYSEALAQSRSVKDLAILLSRTGRCDFKMGKYRSGIAQYRKLLAISDEGATVAGIPPFVVALTQLADGYAALHDSRSRPEALLELYERLVNRPWEVSADKCAYYLRLAGKELKASADRPAEKLEELDRRSKGLLEDIRRLEWIREILLPQITARPIRSSSHASQKHVFEKYEGADVQYGSFEIPDSPSGSAAATLGYQFDGDSIVSDLLPRILNNINLGRDVGIGILDETGRMRFAQIDYYGSTYLTAASFDEILPSWKVVMVHSEGKSVNELVSKEKWGYLALLAGTFLVMITGILLTVRAAAHELELSRLKTEFVSNVSHEFKTPLSLIRMFGETLESGMVQDEAKRGEFYRIIRSESERLTRLINNVLDFSRIEAGVKRYNFQEAEIGSIVRKALDAYKLEIRNLGFTIDCRLPSTPVFAHIDPDAICEALINLLDNAAKYSEEDKQIAVNLETSESWIRISVSDHGMGIPKDELENIFHKYYRSQTRKTRETAGSGLGLTLVKHIIDSHGGRAEVETEVGRGSTFTLLIPIKS
jgi:signal transduction histidine kinase